MLEYVLAPQNLPFAVALMVMVALGMLEVVTTALGFAASHLVDGLLPDFDFELDTDLDLDPDGHALAHASPHMTPWAAALDWLHLGRVPTLLLLLVMLGAFGAVGLSLQSVASSLLGVMLPAWLAAVPAFLLSLPVVRVVGGALARFIPKEESSAVSRESFVGQMAQVVTGTARVGEPAQAKLTDEHGQTHYFLVEPEPHQAELPQGSSVIIIGRRGVVFKAVANDIPELTTGE